MNKFELPKDWRGRLSRVQEPSTKKYFMEMFNVNNAALTRWINNDIEFFRVIDPLIRKVKPKPKRICQAPMTPDEIDDVLFDLLGDTAYAATAIKARTAIRQLRKELRHERSMNNALRAAEHMRKTRGLPVHANGGGVAL